MASSVVMEILLQAHANRLRMVVEAFEEARYNRASGCRFAAPHYWWEPGCQAPAVNSNDYYSYLFLHILVLQKYSGLLLVENERARFGSFPSYWSTQRNVPADVY